MMIKDSRKKTENQPKTDPLRISPSRFGTIHAVSKIKLKTAVCYWKNCLLLLL